MPRLPTLRTRVLQELARQLRFESADAARRQLARAEELAMQLLEESATGGGAPAYPEEWVVFRITGLRAEASGDNGVVVREALLSDLPALVDRLSSAAKLREEDLRAPDKRGTSKGGRTGGRAASATPSHSWLDVKQLCDRWKVSRKTLERYRRLGLVSRRVTSGRRTERVVYSEDCVRAFERVHGPRVREAGEFTRMGAAAERRLVRHAARYRARFGWSLHRCAQRVAAREGRSVEGVRRLLHRHDAKAEKPIFDEPGPLDAEQRAWIERAARHGGNMTGAAAKVRKSRGTVYRVVGERRAARLKRLDLHGPVGPLFERKDAAEVLLGHESARMGLGAPGPSSVGELVRAAAGIEPETAALESARAAAYWFLIWSAARELEHRESKARTTGGQAASATHSKLDAAETKLLWASRLKVEMVRSQLPLLVRTIEAQTGRRIGELPSAAARELVEIGIEALIDSVERYDPFKGGRLAAPVGIGLTRAVSQWLRADGTRLGAPGRATARVDLDRIAIVDFARRVHSWQEWLEAPLGVRERLAELDERYKRVLELRYGWTGGPPRTLAEAAQEMGTTTTRAAAMQRRAVAQLAYAAPSAGKPKRPRRKRP